MKSGGNISGFKESGGAIQHVMTIRLVGPPLDELAVVGGLLDDTGRVDGKRAIAPHAKRMVDMGGIHNCSCWVLLRVVCAPGKSNLCTSTVSSHPNTELAIGSAPI